jgi:4'-phosphopantetheinyl transferase
MIPKILFDPPPENLKLQNGEVHVFCARLDQPAPRLARLAEMLSQDERARAARFVFERDRNRFIAGRGMLREILGWLLHIEPTRLAFSYGDHGKPRLAAPVAGRFLHFNLAHSDALAVYAVSAREEVGIDIERVRPVTEAEEIAAYFFSTRELAEWRSLPAACRLEGFFHCWTRKESLLKSIGTGLGEPSPQIEVPPFPDECTHSLPTPAAPVARSGVFVHSLMPAWGYSGAVATGGAKAPRCWQWQGSADVNDWLWNLTCQWSPNALVPAGGRIRGRKRLGGRRNYNDQVAAG